MVKYCKNELLSNLSFEDQVICLEYEWTCLVDLHSDFEIFKLVSSD